MLKMLPLSSRDNLLCHVQQPGRSLTLLSPSLANLGRETGLDCSNTSSRTAGVACNEVQSVFSFVEFGVWRSAGLAGDVFHCAMVSMRNY